MAFKQISKILPDTTIIDDKTGKEVVSASVIVDTDKVEVTYDDYVVMDHQAFNYLKQRLSVSDLGRLVTFCDMVDGEFNLITDRAKNVPHTTVTLRMNLAYSKNNYILFMKKLFELNIIYYIQAFDRFTGKSVKWIMLNPNLARKRKVFDISLRKYFTNLPPTQK